MPIEPCHNALCWLGEDEMGKLLDEAGDERFRQKATRFAAAMAEEPPSEVLYQGIMEALGYTRNKDPFQELARCLPLAVLRSVGRDKCYRERVVLLRAMLLVMAGLLPRGNARVKMAPHCLTAAKPLSLSHWNMFRVRPENHPARRLTGVAHLLACFLDEGPLEGVIRLVDESRSDIGRLEAAFIVSGEGFRSRNQRALIGHSRARDIVINIALPFVFAWAEANSEADLADSALWLYRIYPKSSDNNITHRMVRLLGTRANALVDSARRQRGLIHLNKTFCSQRKCDICPVNKKLVSVQDVGAMHELPLRTLH